MTDQEFLKQHANEIIETKIFGTKKHGIKVGNYLIILGGDAGYYLYSLQTKTLLIKKPFETICLAHKFAENINIQYSEYMPLLEYPEYVENFFGLTQYSVTYGKLVAQKVQQLNSKSLITD